jgi:hypothetical protein
MFPQINAEQRRAETIVYVTLAPGISPGGQSVRKWENTFSACFRHDC